MHNKIDIVESDLVESGENILFAVIIDGIELENYLLTQDNRVEG